MNKYQKAAYRLAKYEERTGMIHNRNIQRQNNKYRIKLRRITVKTQQNLYYNFFKREKYNLEQLKNFKQLKRWSHEIKKCKEKC